MSDARLAASVVISGLIRKAESEGGFAAVLARGDSTAGAILVLMTEKGGNPRLYERLLQADGSYSWQALTSQVSENSEEVAQSISKKRRFDPDLWVLELDIPSAERFAAEMNEVG